MQKNDAIWLMLIAVSLGLGVVGGQYLKKDELLPICHAIAPGLISATERCAANKSGRVRLDTAVRRAAMAD